MLAWMAAIALRGSRADRWFWLAGLAAYLSHIAFAFDYYHDWSQAAAWEATARDTKELTGWESGVGLLVNYAFVIWLVVELARQFRRENPASFALEGFVFFMIVNGAIVFGERPVRLFGAILCAMIVAIWILRLRPRSPGNSSESSSLPP